MERRAPSQNWEICHARTEIEGVQSSHLLALPQVQAISSAELSYCSHIGVRSAAREKGAARYRGHEVSPQKGIDQPGRGVGVSRSSPVLRRTHLCRKGTRISLFVPLTESIALQPGVSGVYRL